MNWLHYLVEANIYLSVFYLFYCVFLTKETHYTLNRMYLLGSSIIAFMLPLIQVGMIKPAVHLTQQAVVIPENIVYTDIPAHVVLPETITTLPAKVLAQTQVALPAKSTFHVDMPAFTLQDILFYSYLAGAAIAFILLTIKFYKLFKLRNTQNSDSLQGYKMVYLENSTTAFSFFNYLFIGSKAPGKETIIRHELVHIRQKHSVDIMLMEVFKIINWFNPLIYLLQNSLKTVHEYIADEQTAAKETDTLTYSTFLVNNAYGIGGPVITHSFFNYNLLKKRIIMLHQQRSGKLARLKYLVAAPICAALLCASTLGFSKTYGWVDLAPAKAISAGGTSNANHALKRKRLKITQNGVTTITDQLAVEQKNKKVVFTAGTITDHDKSLLVKNQHIKVEVVDDSIKYTNKDGKLILPVVNVDGYYLLDHFLHNSIHYTTAKGEKGGLVEVGFSLDQDRHITNAKIVKSGGAKLDALALNGFNAYKGIVTDDSGKNYKIGVYFFTDDYSIFKTDSLGKDPEFAGELIVTNYKYPTSITSKGYEFDESGGGFPGDGSNMTYAKVVIYEKNGEAKWYYKSKCTPADFKMLKDKYGYTFPSATSSIVQFIYGANIKKYRMAYMFNATSYLEEPYADHFYNYMTDNVVYPEQAQKELKGGVVVLNFNLDNNGIISDATVAQSAGRDFDGAAMNALQSYKEAIKDKAGKHSIAVLFCVAEKKYQPDVSEIKKKEGYVGELAISDVKSPFKGFTKVSQSK